ncbi:S-layer homology domain-containing protein [Oscillospiraceae bacterium OttesenSCG-928-F05]|nr:S-layer homology domain-containing protein [Oscillospiraceae bacterium OttesenSCG-928-F05]
MKKTLNKLLSAVLALTLVMSFGTTAFAATFTDVNDGSNGTYAHWAYDAVERAVANDLVHGMGNGTYEPNKAVTNAEWSQMVTNLFWSDFKPVRGNPWWFDAMDYPHNRGWLNGTVAHDNRNTTSISPYNEQIAGTVISRYDMAQVIYNITQSGQFTLDNVNTSNIENAIADYRQIPTRYRTAVKYCYAAGFIVGVDDAGTFDGEIAMNRGAAATVLCRLLDANNGDWTVPDNNSGTETPSNNTAVKDMITVKSTERQNYDYEITVKNTYTKDKLSNGKDITDANIAAMLKEIEIMFPAGTSWAGDGSTGDTYYYSGAPRSGGGCASFASMTFETLFGKGVTTKSSANLRDAKPGDVIQFYDSSTKREHWVVVQSVSVETMKKLVNGKPVETQETRITFCEGNAGGKVQWNTQLFVTEILAGYPNSTLYTAY